MPIHVMPFAHLSDNDLFNILAYAAVWGLLWGIWPRRHPDEKRTWRMGWLLSVLTFSPLWVMLWGLEVYSGSGGGLRWYSLDRFASDLVDSADGRVDLKVMGALYGYATLSLLPLMLAFEAGWWVRRHEDAGKEAAALQPASRTRR